MNKYLRSALFVYIALHLVACSTTIERNPIPASKASSANVPGLPKQIRIWGDVPFPESWIKAAIKRHKSLGLIATEKTSGKSAQTNILALSGGADDGAFGAGLLVGWSARGDRPDFNYVTGISTGALIAPFAFLGSDWDWVLREIYTQYSTKDIAVLRSLISIPFSDSAADTSPMKKLLEKYVTQDVLDAVADNYHRGKTLVIGTTHLDAQRPMLWNMGLIASSQSENALPLFRKIMLASAAIPIIFPPVYIDVELHGNHYDEMHVDGGTVSQLVVFPPGIDIKKLNIQRRQRNLYLIRNARLEPEWGSISPDLISIGDRSISTMIKSQGNNDLYEIWEMSKRQGINYRLASIPEDFTGERQESFDIAYMKKLFQYAYKLSEKGYPWKQRPPKVLTHSR